MKRCFAVIATLLVFSSWNHAEEHTAEYVLPQIAQRGTDIRVVVVGNLLETAEEILFYRDGIECTAIKQLTEYPENGKTVEAEAGKAISLDLKISADAKIGQYLFRIRTKRHLSELLSFWVTPFPVVDEAEPFSTKNDDIAQAQRVPLNCTVVGYQPKGPPNDFDFYEVELAKGQRCTAQILSARLGTYHYSGLTDMAIEVTSPSLKRIARSDDTPLLGQDPYVSFIAPETGVYSILARQQMDYETLPRHYAMHVGDFERPVATYPLGGKAGDKIEATLFLEDGSYREETITLPKEVGEFEKAIIDYAPNTPASNQLKVADFSNILESDATSDPDNPQIVDTPLPLALNGIIKEEGERDWYQISAKAGERYRVRAFSRTIGSQLDPFIWIRPAPGNPSKANYEEDDSLWDGHDWEGHHYRHQVKDRLDPVFMFEPDQDGDYLIGIGDTRREHGPDYIYRVEIQPHHDSLFVHFPSYPSKRDITRDVIGIHRGSTFSHPLAIQNGFGSEYDGPMRLEAIGLPDEIKFESPVFTRNDPVILATFSAPADATLQSGLFEMVPVPVDESHAMRGGFVMTAGATQRRGDYNIVFHKTRFAPFAILEEAPFTVHLEQPKVGLAKDAELKLEVSIKRKEGFTGAVYAEMDWLPPGVSKQPPLLIPEGDEEGFYTVTATNKAKEGKYRLSINVRENEGGDVFSGIGFHFVAAPSIDIEVLDPYLTITLERATAEQGKESSIVGAITQLRKFEGEAAATLLRLPTGVSLIEPAKISSDDKEVVFRIRAAKDALVGQAKNLGCDIEIRDGGQSIHQQTGDGVLRIDAARN